jgi:hypothetical protein
MISFHNWPTKTTGSALKRDRGVNWQQPNSTCLIFFPWQAETHAIFLTWQLKTLPLMLNAAPDQGTYYSPSLVDLWGPNQAKQFCPNERAAHVRLPPCTERPSHDFHIYTIVSRTRAAPKRRYFQRKAAAPNSFHSWEAIKRRTFPFQIRSTELIP